VFAVGRAQALLHAIAQLKALASHHGPMVILAASGMATGGRVLHHLELHAGKHNNMIILTGYQAPGTRGDTLVRGEKAVRIHGRDIAVHAEVVQLQSASSHADAGQTLQWLRSMPQAPEQVYVTHGELPAADTLRARIEHELGWRAVVPEHGSVWPA
jgi:metallo-beta-lactamase family protein